MKTILAVLLLAMLGIGANLHIMPTFTSDHPGRRVGYRFVALLSYAGLLGAFVFVTGGL
jgi:hypothetical protein